MFEALFSVGVERGVGYSAVDPVLVLCCGDRVGEDSGCSRAMRCLPFGDKPTTGRQDDGIVGLGCLRSSLGIFFVGG